MVDKSKSEEEIYYAALKEPPDNRSAYIKAACGDDLELLERVESLFKIRENSNNFLESPLFIDQPSLSTSPLEQPGTVIGRYKILEKIGEGGMAVVYMAEQQEPIRRKVALKIIKLGMDTKSVIARFEAERQALAMMDHPNIAKVFDAGATESGRPYFVMELVTGVSIIEYCDKNNLSTKERLALFIQVCNAVQHAHLKGIIHRDIKPTNVMVTLYDGKPVPKVIDFGIAKAINQKLTEKTLFTRYAHIIGTPAYMSPEQAELSDLDIDARTDIYSLGVLLYKLLTGTLPFSEEELRKAGFIEMQRVIREQDPAKPSTKLSTLGKTLDDIARQRGSTPDLLKKAIRGDLDRIIMKALEKQRERRYNTSAELSADINRHLNHQPVQAVAPSLPYKMHKFVKRHRIDILVASLVGAAAVTTILILMWFFTAPRAFPADSMSSTDGWIERLKGLKGHNSAAFGVGPELVELDPDFGLKVVEAAWPELTDFQVKRGLLKAFHFSKPLYPKKHPYVLKVLHLGMTDKDEKVREYAAVYVKEYALEDFSGNLENYSKWYKKYGDLSIEEIIRLNQNRKIPALKEKLKEIIDEFEKGDMDQVQRLGREIGQYGYPYSIPTLIGIIDADNSYDTIYGIGYFALGFSVGLGPVTKVEYSPYHDGAWWRRWWEKNKSRFPQEVQKIPIPDLPKTEHGKNHTPFPENMDTLEGCLAWLLKIFEDGGQRTDIWDIARQISEFADPNAIPTLIAVIEADNTYDTVYGIGYFGLRRMTGVRYSEKHDGTWWRNWWQANKSKYPEDVQKMEIPDYHELVASWRKKVAEKENNRALADVENVPAEELTVGGNAEMSYFLIGAGKDATAPKEGYNLVVIIPGGDGGKNFHPFVRRIYKYALSNKFLVAQLVAFKWNEKQKIVWPTKDHPTDGQKFTMEDFTEAVIQDVKKYHKINERNIFTLSWSSGGPAGYAVSLNKSTQVKGSFIAMSVFRRDWLPPLDAAKGHIYYLLYSPEDKLCPFSNAKQAKEDLTEAGAIVRLDTYEGGHGWHGDVYGHIQRGIGWLIEQVDKADGKS